MVQPRCERHHDVNDGAAAVQPAGGGPIEPALQRRELALLRQRFRLAGRRRPCT